MIIKECSKCQGVMGNLDNDKEICSECVTVLDTPDGVVSTWEVRCPHCKNSWGLDGLEISEYEDQGKGCLVFCPFCEGHFEIWVETVVLIKSPPLKNSVVDEGENISEF